ncbi:hypothetical protein MTR_7g072585 [Medicago truncatula]|uniref:Uncharacterized protein n=1 Tax=Medicago truncatula TaxID=3880 RepID=A0A072U241_MEDTR|nr:hypothetical protein MTR_7g072585 [Medicago truncatula]
MPNKLQNQGKEHIQDKISTRSQKGHSVPKILYKTCRLCQDFRLTAICGNCYLQNFYKTVIGS